MRPCLMVGSMTGGGLGGIGMALVTGRDAS